MLGLGLPFGFNRKDSLRNRNGRCTVRAWKRLPNGQSAVVRWRVGYGSPTASAAPATFVRLAHSSASATLPVVSAAILALIGLIGTALLLFNAPLSGEQTISFVVDGVIMLACGLAGIRIARR